MEKIILFLCCILTVHLTLGQENNDDYDKFVRQMDSIYKSGSFMGQKITMDSSVFMEKANLAYKLRARLLNKPDNENKLNPEYYSLIAIAESLYKKKEYKNSALTYSQAFKTLGWKGTLNDRYNAARACTMSNYPDSAFFNLYRITERLSFGDYDRISKEEAFKGLYKDERWNPLMELIKRNKTLDIPKGWSSGGSNLNEYNMGLDENMKHNGKRCATIKSKIDSISDFGTMLQYCSPAKFLGNRVRMTGYLKTQNVSQWAGFWLRIDKEDSNAPLAFDNMKDGKKDRSVTGTTDWQKYEIVLDIPDNAYNVAFGALLSGTGQIWFDNLTFEIVDKSVPTTGKPAPYTYSRNQEPTNLDFEE